MTTRLSSLLEHPPSWLAEGDHRDGIVLSTRIRLARNLADQPFRSGLSQEDQEALVDHLQATALQTIDWQDHLTCRLSELSETERTTLLERRIISRELAGCDHPAGILTRIDQTAALMFNEEDHLRLQVLRPGLALRAALDEAIALDHAIELAVNWAVDGRFGYLTACPTNAGTGLRASVMLHLPALAEADELARALRGLSKLHLAARGLYGEGSEATGHFLQISNQRTLGRTEGEIVAQLTEVVESLITYEHLSRAHLLEHQRTQIEDRVYRAWGLLTHARRLSSKELVEQLALVRLGKGLGLINHPEWLELDRLFLEAQPGHLRLRQSAAEDPERRDELRADRVRATLN